MKMTNLHNNFSTADYPTCVVLCSLGFSLVFVNRTNPLRCSFEFAFDPEIEIAIKSFYEGKLRLDPRVVLLNAKLVKDRLHGGY